uniref:Zinc finger protein 410 isoform X4 n=1 Tax=Geotrypetes seraphini TaxID=260995 RepID=A0A6P8RML1_GEOSA|nr:zinc finger protein 410 isoform X4 [Geotrypetes seraphini]
MLSDELESKPELLVQFVQNTSIPLGESLGESKDLTCLSLLPVTETSECSQLLLSDVSAHHSTFPKVIPSSSLLRGLQVSMGHSAEDLRADMVQKPAEQLSNSESSPVLQDIQSSDNTSFILLNLTRAGLGPSAEHLVFVQDEVEDSGNDFLSNSNTDSNTPWFLRVQELAHDSLIAATRAQLAKNVKANNGGEKPFLCEVKGCGRSFAEYSSLRKHLVIHSGVKPHQCQICGKTFSQSGSRNVHIRKHHSKDITSVLGTQEEMEVLIDGSSSPGSQEGAHDDLSQMHSLRTITAGRQSYEDDMVLLQ